MLCIYLGEAKKEARKQSEDEGKWELGKWNVLAPSNIPVGNIQRMGISLKRADLDRDCVPGQGRKKEAGGEKTESICETETATQVRRIHSWSK